MIVWMVVTFPPKMLTEIRRIVRREKLPVEDMYCPMTMTQVSKKGIVKRRAVPMYMNYMFWKCDPNQLDMTRVRELVPVRPLVRGRKIQVVDDKEIARIEKSEREVEEFQSYRGSQEYLKKMIGKSIVIRDGNFDGMSGEVMGVSKSSKLVVEVFILGRYLNCDISSDYVELV